MTQRLHVHEFGSPNGIPLLALHGLTGHGARWRSLATAHLPEYRVIAPDLRGHGRSTPLPPWTLEQHAADVLAVIDDRELDAVPVLAHSFGGNVALHLARLAPGRVSCLILLDPAVGLDPAFALENADAPHGFFADPAQAWESQRADWPVVSDDVVTQEINEHLEQVDGGWRLRYCPPAITTAWSEMTRTPVLPGRGTPTVAVKAHGQPFASAAFLNGCELALGAAFQSFTVDCGHMIYLERPAETAELVSRYLNRA
jgi:lipase